ncbi:PrsW family intramembrane metalloprotease [Aquihabitans sp. G128]|uniref:PrsW family intramembrane metalloprotease n=1 Tax=Aquihabitans sp. G128 TaxID=2849779 RepID=UPI001C243D03|nr:PrsW family intramembrane metalloprotease [Aquihabitans sp. G128]QXC62486.1 PrsW family intramembrane metalloprotease [Aquihabitans sp. G128]
MGLDRRAFVPAAVVLGIILLMTAVVPAVNEAVGWDDEVEAGDVIDMGDGVTFVPPVGWELLSGIRLDDEPSTGLPADAVALVAGGGVAIRVQRGPFDGTSTDLLAQLNRLHDRSGDADDQGFKVTSAHQSVTTSSGITGVSETVTSASGDARFVAFTVGGDRGGADHDRGHDHHHRRLRRVRRTSLGDRSGHRQRHLRRRGIVTATIDDTPVAPTAQEAAIEASGWGEPFRLVQLRNPLFWLYVWAVGSGVVHLVRVYEGSVANYGGALAAGTILFGIYTVPWVLFLHHRDRFTSEAPKLLAAGFLWGAVPATFFLAITVNDAVLTLYAKLFGQAWASDWGAGLTAPFTEETSKALGLVILLGLAPRLVRNAYDAFVIGAFIGLGFEVSEDVLYVYQGAGQHFGTNQPVAVLQMVVVRGASGVVSHALFSAIFCTGLYWVLGRGVEGRRLGHGLFAMAAAMAFHGVWDDAGALGNLIHDTFGIFVVIPLVIVASVATVIFVAREASSTEKTWMHDLLAPEVAAGILTEDEAEAMALNHHAQRKHLKKTVRGHHDRKVARHVLEAAHDLAEAIARDRGEPTPAVEHARAEVTRVRSL